MAALIAGTLAGKMALTKDQTLHLCTAATHGIEVAQPWYSSSRSLKIVGAFFQLLRTLLSESISIKELVCDSKQTRASMARASLPTL